MRKNTDDLRAELIASLKDAEELAARIDSLGEDYTQMSLIYRWAEAADGVALQMVQAEEQLAQGELMDLQKMVNAEDETCWEKYRRNIRWMNKPRD